MNRCADDVSFSRYDVETIQFNREEDEETKLII